MGPGTSGRTRFADWWLYIVALVTSSALTYWFLELWRADLRVPFGYRGDALLNGAIAKGLAETGWYLANPRLGAPLGQLMYEFPGADGLHYVWMRLITLVVPDYAVVTNLYLLLTFPLTALVCLWALRRLGASRVAAVGGSLLYAFLPYHILRGTAGHLLLAAYYLVPAVVVVILWSMERPVLLTDRSSGRPRLEWKTPDALAAIGICFLVGSAGIYYAYFACVLLLVGGSWAALRSRRWTHLVSAALLAGVIVLSGLVNVAPTLAYRVTNGPNPVGIARSPIEAEMGGLKVDQMLLPVDGHRLAPLAALKAGYVEHLAGWAPWLVNENLMATLGTVMGLGFVALVGWALLATSGALSIGSRRDVTMNGLSLLNLAALLLGTAGGFGAIIAVGLTTIRSYNRIVVFIAFFAVAAVALLLDRLAEGVGATDRRRLVTCAGIAVVFALGLLDATSPGIVPDYAASASTVKVDAAFVRDIETSVPAGSMVFQLPYMPFPEPRPAERLLFNGLDDYAHLGGYLNSKTLRWSFGSMKGREGDIWYKSTADLPAPAMVDELKKAGFAGVWVDRRGYKDEGDSLIAQLFDRASGPAIRSSDGTRVFVPLR